MGLKVVIPPHVLEEHRPQVWAFLSVKELHPKPLYGREGAIKKVLRMEEAEELLSVFPHAPIPLDPKVLEEPFVLITLDGNMNAINKAREELRRFAGQQMEGVTCTQWFEGKCLKDRSGKYGEFPAHLRDLIFYSEGRPGQDEIIERLFPEQKLPLMQEAA